MPARATVHKAAPAAAKQKSIIDQIAEHSDIQVIHLDVVAQTADGEIKLTRMTLSPKRSGPGSAMFYAQGKVVDTTNTGLRNNSVFQANTMFTFVKSKLALEEMAAGQVLEVTVDNSESASNVPRSIELEGHEIVGVSRQVASSWRIVVRKAGP